MAGAKALGQNEPMDFRSKKKAAGAGGWEIRRAVGKTGSEKQEGAGTLGEFCSGTEELSGKGSEGCGKEQLPLLSDLFHLKVIGNLWGEFH